MTITRRPGSANPPSRPAVGSIFAQVRHDDRVVAIDADTAFGKLGARVDLDTTGYWDLAGPPTSTSTPSPTCARGSDDPPPSWHRLGPLQMPLKAQRCRHRAVAVPVVLVAGLWSASGLLRWLRFGSSTPWVDVAMRALGLGGGLAFRVVVAPEPSPG
jgi:hypothetical protein